MAKVAPKFGLGAVMSRLVPDVLVAKGSGALESAYTESGAVPGHPEPADASSRWRPQVTGAQSVDIAVRTLQGGFAGRDAASVLARLGTESGLTDWRGWDEPNMVTDWTAPTDAWGSASAWTAFAAAVLPTGVIVIVGCDGSSNAQTWSYDPRSGTWTTLYDWDASTGDGLSSPLGMAYDADRERIILWSGSGSAGASTQVAYYSDDGGTTWALYARGFLGVDFTPTNVGAYRVVTHPSGQWLLLALDDERGTAGGGLGGTGVAEALYSADRGVTWLEVEGQVGYAPWPVLGPAGFVVVYIHLTSDDLMCRIQASATSSFADATEIVISNDYNFQQCWACVDDDGTIYAYGLGESTDLDACYCFRSTDGGLTWTEYRWQPWNTGTSTVYLTPWTCVASGGALHLVASPNGSTGCDNTLTVTTFGGWSQVAAGHGNERTRRDSRHGWGSLAAIGGGSLVSKAAMYLPWALPAAMGWTKAGTGTESLSPASNVGLETSCTAGQSLTYTKDFTSETNDFMCGEAALKNTDDSATLATIGTGVPGLYIRPILTNNVYTYEGTIDIGRNGIQVRDGATIRASATVDTTTDKVYLRWHLTKGTFTVWYRVGAGTSWTRLANAVTITDGGATGDTEDTVVWGNGTGAVGRAHWYLVAAATEADWRYSVDTITEAGDGWSTRVAGHAFGRPIPGRGWAVAAPFGSAAGEDMARLTASGGPTYTGEQVTLPTAYTYPIDAIHPTLSPSPRKQWRATGSTEVRLVYDLTEPVFHGGAIALLALNADFRQAVLEMDDGAGGVTTLGTLDKGWASINYTLTGYSLMPRTSTATISRYIEHGELVGGYVIMNTGASDVARRIVGNTPGYWTTNTVQRVRIEVEGIDGTETAAGSGTIVHPSGVLVVYPTATTPRQFIRVKIAASQTVPGGTYKAGVLAVARVVALGSDPAWGWSSTMQLARRTSRGTDGALSVRETGPARRVDTYSWPHGMVLRNIRTLAAPADYLGVVDGIALGSSEDVWSSPLGLIAEELESGAVPMVLFRQLPSSTSTITDRTLYRYGRLAVDSVTLTGILGTEGTDEVVTVSGITVEEIP